MVCRQRKTERLSCITFDDGYLDNFSLALPVLKSENVTATFFIATSYLDGSAMFNDIVRHAIKTTDASVFIDPFRASVPVQLGTSISRSNLTRVLIEKLKYLSPNVRDEHANQIAASLHVQAPVNLMMRPPHLKSLLSEGMSIGSHTHRHIVATTVSETDFRNDVAQSVNELRMVTGIESKLFAFPNGRTGTDQSSIHIDIIKKLGFEIALTTDLGSVQPASNVLSLPRFTPWAKTRVGFHSQLTLSRLGAYSSDPNREVHL